MNKFTSLVLSAATLTGCTNIRPAWSPTLEAQKAVEARIEQERQAQELIAQEREAYGKRFEDTLLMLGEETKTIVSADIQQEAKTIARGFEMPFVSGLEKRDFEDMGVSVLVNIHSKLNDVITEQLQLYFYQVDGDNYFGVGTTNKDLAKNFAFRPMSRVTEPDPETIQVSSGGMPQGFFYDDPGLTKMFGDVYFGLLSDEGLISFFDRSQTLQLFLEGNHVADVEFRFTKEAKS